MEAVVVLALRFDEEEIGLELLDGSTMELLLCPLLLPEDDDEEEVVSVGGGARGGRWLSLKYKDIWRRSVEFRGPRSCCTAFDKNIQITNGYHLLDPIIVITIINEKLTIFVHPNRYAFF